MIQVNETKKVLDKAKKLGLTKRYEKQKKLFITDPSLASLDFVMWDSKTRIFSFKITNQYRIKLIKNSKDLYTIFDIDDFHRHS